jgi:hypothetical protein
MQTSKYAPKTPAETLAHSRAEKLKQDKDNSTRLLGRLRWKAEMLMVSYYKALEIVRAADAQQNGHAGADPLSVSDRNTSLQARHETDTIKKQAESMFKVDFFEFYTLLERYLTTCLAIVGVKVSGAAPQTNVNALRYITNPDLHRTRPIASHAFHANLLEALEDENCLLHAALGEHNVRVELGLAKDFRNAWKDADGRIIASKWDDNASRKNITLHDSQLEAMLRTLLTGCENAHVVVQQFSPVQGNAFTSKDFEPQAHNYNIGGMEDTPLEYMDDAMELD